MDVLALAATECTPTLDAAVEASMGPAGRPASKPLAEPSLRHLLEMKFAVTMPQTMRTDARELVDYFGSFLFPLAMTLSLPSMLYVLAAETESRLREVQRVHGMREFPYFAAVYGSNLLLYMATAVVFCASGLAVQLRFFTQTSSALIFLVLLRSFNPYVAYDDDVVAASAQLGLLLTSLGALCAKHVPAHDASLLSSYSRPPGTVRSVTCALSADVVLCCVFTFDKTNQ